jgi:cellulose synthase/poly-beta-1,6-N-acetylglucosamine synthase-like glycosyltransferase
MGTYSGIAWDAISLIPAGLSIIAASGAIKRLFRRENMRRSNNAAEAKALVIMPCKGEDIRFEDTLEAVKAQGYRDYKIVAVTDSDEDPAYALLAKHGIETVITDKALLENTDCSGKNRAVITALNLYSDAFDIFVVLDSDTTVGVDWLGLLAAPLMADERIGLTTTFPLFYPLSGFWSKVKTVWGLAGIGMQDDERTIFAWGGSMAFKSSIIKAAIRELSNSTADDIALGKACKELGLKIAAVSNARPTVYVNETFKTFAEWSVRQTALSILGNRNVFTYGIAYYSAFCVNDLALLYLLYLSSPLALLFALPVLISVIGFYVQTKMRSPIYCIIVALMPLVYMADLIAGRRTKRIRWRGAEYRLA